MNSITFVLLLTVLGCAIAQETNRPQQLTTILQNADVLTEFPEASQDCARTFSRMLGGCFADIFSYKTVEEIRSSLFFNAQGNLEVSTLDLLFDLSIRGDYDDVSLTVDGCCQHVCEFFRAGCACDRDDFFAILRILGTDAVELLTELRNACVADLPSLSFDAVIRGGEQCAVDSADTRASYVCS